MPGKRRMGRLAAVDTRSARSCAKAVTENIKKSGSSVGELVYVSLSERNNPAGSLELKVPDEDAPPPDVAAEEARQKLEALIARSRTKTKPTPP